jgi:hypothetical protein
MNQEADKKIRADLERIHEWAGDKIGAGNEPPWAWYQYMKLRETLDAILAGMDSVSPTANLQQSGSHQGAVLRLVDSKHQQDTAQHHLSGTPVRLPT